MRKLLFVCSRNKKRSLTAEHLFEGKNDLSIRSRGTEKNARIRVNAGDLGWADEIFVMEKRHADRLREKFSEALGSKPLINLRIKDLYELDEPKLVA